MKLKKIISPIVVIALTMLLVSPVLTTAQKHRRRRHVGSTPRTTTTNGNAPASRTSTTGNNAPGNPAPASTSAPITVTRATGTTTGATATTEGERVVVDRPVESLLSADGYAVHVEVRNIGQLVRSGEVKKALAALRLSGEMPKDFSDFFGFLSANAEELNEARVVVSTSPARARLPQTLVALELSSAESATKFEPKLRALASQVLGIAPETKSTTVVTTTRTGQAAPRQTSSAQLAAQRDKPALAFKRAGRWLFAADKPFTFKQLKGDGANLLADNARFQSISSRFASEPVFCYFDLKLFEQSTRLSYEQAEREMHERAGKDKTWNDGEPSTGSLKDVQPVPVVIAETTEAKNTPVEAQATPSPEETPSVVVDEIPSLEKEAENAKGIKDAPPAPPAPDPSGTLMMMLGGALWDGGMHTPEALGIAVALEGDAVAVRVLVTNKEGEPLSVVPLIPNLIAGPAMVPDTPTVAPADTDIFFSTTLDWPRIYNALLTKMNDAPSHMATLDESDSETMPSATLKPQAEPPNAEKTVEAVEKLLGFKIREDLLPSLGNEVALSLPLSTLNGGAKFNRAGDAKDGAAKAGPVVIIALNNPDKMRAILPKVLALAGLGVPGAQPQTEKHEGFEIQHFGAASFAFINNFLVAGENAASVRHVIDAYQSQQTLASRPSYRDSSGWQPRQKLAQVFVSEALMKTTLDDLKRRSEDMTDPVLLALISKLNVEPQAAAYAATAEGDAVLHELRLPISLIETYAAGIFVGVKDAPAQSGELMILYDLTRIRDAEESFRTTKGEGKFGTREELQAAKLIEKNFATRKEYKLTLTASGDKYEATATPAEYGKTGRRSFYLNETGILRAANHKGQPATASDPPID